MDMNIAKKRGKNMYGDWEMIERGKEWIEASEGGGDINKRTSPHSGVMSWQSRALEYRGVLIIAE